MTDAPTPTIYTHPARPAWGNAVLISEKGNYLYFRFEDGRDRTFTTEYVHKLKEIELPYEEAVELDRLLRARAQSDEKAKKSRKKSPRKPAKPTISFEEQVARFEKIFPGGFEGERFIKEERGNPEIRGKKGYKAGAITQAQEDFPKKTFKNKDDSDIYETAAALLQAQNIVYANEGTIPFRELSDEELPAFVAALKALLHGSGPYAKRFDDFVGSFTLPDAKKRPHHPRWTLSTIFPALYAPSDHVAVKTTYFARQARIVGLPLEYKTLPSGDSYSQFLAVAKEVENRLKALGHSPRDLVDVYSFVWRTLRKNAENDLPKEPKKSKAKAKAKAKKTSKAKK